MSKINKQDELKEISTQLQKIKEAWGVKAFEEITHYCFTLYRKIEDLIISRENWKYKYKKLKNEL